uniref:hypothetical protein n=1 Tax=Paractinoplanes polyasparticus TaxID=2856853 RepID=UPI001C858F1D|nr:hypothetical protein [Actinoplanes polyasparticus]
MGAILSFLFTSVGEKRREQWAVGREWRQRRLDAYGKYVSDIKRMRDLAQRIAAAVGLDDQAPQLSRDAGLDLLTEANMARSNSFEAINLIAGNEVILAGRQLNLAVWRMEWFARGFLDDSDREGWSLAFRDYFEAVNSFHEAARMDLGIDGGFSPRSAEVSPRVRYELDRQKRSLNENE